MALHPGHAGAANRELLREAYDRVREHLRHYCGDMDTKDLPIRMVPYGPGAIASWGRRLVSRVKGLLLPEIRVPEPPDA